MSPDFILISLGIWGIGCAIAAKRQLDKQRDSAITFSPVPGYASINPDKLKVELPWPTRAVEALDSPGRSRLILSIEPPPSALDHTALAQSVAQWRAQARALGDALQLQVILLQWPQGMLLVACDELGWGGQEALSWAHYQWTHAKGAPQLELIDFGA